MYLSNTCQHLMFTATITRWLQSSSDSALMKTCSTQSTAKLLRGQSHTVLYGEDSRRYVQLSSFNIDLGITSCPNHAFLRIHSHSAVFAILESGDEGFHSSVSKLPQTATREMCHHKKRANKGKHTWPWSFALRRCSKTQVA